MINAFLGLHSPASVFVAGRTVIVASLNDNGDIDAEVPGVKQDHDFVASFKITSRMLKVPHVRRWSVNALVLCSGRYIHITCLAGQSSKGLKSSRLL